MASIGRTPQDFYNNASVREWRQILQCYNPVLQKKASTKSKESAAKELVELDKWYHNELPKIVEKRKPHCLKHEELVKVMKWKLLRGQFRPNLMNLIKSNTLRAVEKWTTASFKRLPDVAKAMDQLTNLKGIGPATASGVIAFLSPDCPFMADEAMLCIPGLEDLEYTRGEFIFYKKKIDECLERLRKEDEEFGWTAHKVDMALWTYYIGLQLDESLIESVIKLQQPAAGSSTTETISSNTAETTTTNGTPVSSSDETEQQLSPDSTTENASAVMQEVEKEVEKTAPLSESAPLPSSNLANGFTEECSSSSDKENHHVGEGKTMVVSNGLIEHNEDTSQGDSEASNEATPTSINKDKIDSSSEQVDINKKRKLEDVSCDEDNAKKTKL